MIQYGARVVGDQQAALRFDRFPELAHQGLVEKMAELTEELAGANEARIPHGATGQLAALLQSGTEDQNDRVRGWVSLGDPAKAKLVIQAAALEYGSTGEAFPVKKHQRGGRSILSLFTQPSDDVDEYFRTGGLDQLDFEHGPFHALAPDALETLNEAVEDAVRKANAS